MSIEGQQALFPEPEQPQPVDIAQFSADIAAQAAQHPHAPEEEHVSEAAYEQSSRGHQPGEPVEDEDHPRRKPEAIAAQKAAQQKRRKRVQRGRESRFTDIGSDTHDSDPAYNPELQTGTSEPKSPETELALASLKRSLAMKGAIRDADLSSPEHFAALARARGLLEEKDQ